MTQQSSPPRAFISSTSIDLPEYRQEVVDTCPTMGYMPLGMRYWPAQDATAEEVCLRKADGTNVFIGIWRSAILPANWRRARPVAARSA
ncbi:MAG: DUF4062 domain-containing protein [Accumulibacter sp.]|uniref:DUF4062 domain-containing protein n=1 Tax=Accumulibacter sp. TaxID=2053492 RepID=UPI002FC31D50